VAGIFMQAVLRALRAGAGRAGVAAGRGAAIAIVQRFGGALNLNIHRQAPSAGTRARGDFSIPTWLAVDRRFSASTQNQALSALMFLYKEVLPYRPLPAVHQRWFGGGEVMTTVLRWRLR
jgi:hypothetical protein